MNNNLKMLLVSFVLALTSSSADSRIAKDRLELAKLIVKFSPSAKIIREADIDTTWCGMVANPGIVKADFNGDGIDDYATLLKVGRVIDSAHSNNVDAYSYEAAKLALVVFLSKKDGGFNTFNLMKSHFKDVGLPVNFFIQTQPSGTITETYSDKTLDLAAPSILLTFCERSAVVIYWDKKKKGFEELWVSD